MFNSETTLLPVQIRRNVNRRGWAWGFALALLLFVSASLQAQDFQWAVKAGSTGDDEGFGLAADAAGNTYVTGMFEGMVTFGSTTLTSAGLSDIFVAKYDASGSVVWAKRAGGTALDQGRDIVVDAAGNAYVTGFFRGASASFGSITLTGGGGAEIFVAKYDASGNEVWAKRAGGAGLQATFSITLDASGNSYIAGYIEGTATFGPGEGNQTILTSLGGDDMIVAKYATNGDLVWAKRAGGSMNAFSFDVGVDAAGNSYVTGSFDGTATFGLGETYETTLASAGVNNYSDIFLAKYDASGALVWAKRAGDVNFDRGRGIRVDAAGNSYVTGRFQSMATFGSTTVTSAGNYDVFVAKYDANGNVIWVTRAGGTGVDDANNITIDATGASYITGVFAGTASFGSTSLSSAGTEDMFAAKYDANGNLVWATRAGGTAHDEGTDVAVDAARNVYFTGLFASAPAAFDALNLSSAGSNDVFVAKIASHCLLVTNTNDAGAGSLRQAILDANALTNIDASTPDTIKFKIPGSGPHTIAPTSALPTIADPVIIDGYSQSGASPGTLLIVINGASAPASTDGLTITAGSSTVQGLVVNGFSRDGVVLQTNGGNTLKGNFIGTDATGTLDFGNGRYGLYLNGVSNNIIGGSTAGEGNLISGNTSYGIYVFNGGYNKIQGNFIGTNITGTAAIANSDGIIIQSSGHNLIGGKTAAARNLISGNTADGIFLAFAGATQDTIIGNYLGTDVTGTLDLGNGADGVAIGLGGHDNVIGGTTAAERNIISGNNRFGVYFVNVGTTGNKIIGNYIGTDVSGTNLLGNSSDGVLLYPDGGNSVGGTSTGEGNLIAYNGRAGVDLVSGNNTTSFNNNNPILGNSIFGNTGLGIDLSATAGIPGEADGLTGNDVGDADVGANKLQNFPVMTLVQRLGNGDVTVTYSVPSAVANSAYPLRIEFFISQGGQGKTFIGVQSYTSANAQLAVTQTFTPNALVSTGDNLVATATDANGNTSEFSGESPVTAPPLFSKQFSPASITAGGVSTLTFTIDNTANSVAATGLDFTDNLPAGVVVASPANASVTCTGGTITATPGAGAITYTGGSISAVASCTIQVDVISVTASTYNNTSGDLTSSLGNSGSASATLTVNPPLVKPFVFLANKITLQSTKQVPSYGDMHSNGTLTVNKGDHSTYNSNLTAVGKITIGKYNIINGDVTSQTSISNSGKINGTKTIGPVNTEPLPSLSYSAGGPNKTVSSGHSLSLAPGSYGIVTLNGSSTLKLTSGEYFMNELRYSSTIKNGVIEIDLSSGDPVTINVVSNLQLGHSAAIRLLPNGEADSKLVTFNTLQTTNADWGREAYLVGSFNAPNAIATLVKNTQLRGSICAKEIYVSTDCLFLHHDSPGSLPGPGNLPKISGSEVTSEQSPVTSYELSQNYPNPFNPTTTISFALLDAGEVSLSIYNMNGQLVKKLVAGEMNAGRHSLVWNATNDRGQQVASGVYLYVIKAANFTAQRKLVLMK
jgi:FlgD Ig-like domain